MAHANSIERNEYMLKSAIKTESIPERVYELCKIVSNHDISESEVRNLMEPLELKPQKNTINYYFGAYRDVALELELIDKEGDILRYIGNKKDVKDLDAFRRYCNGMLYKDTANRFYLILKAFLLSDVNWIGENITSPKIKKSIQEKTDLANIDDKELQGIRFWLAFLGFGYIQESGSVIVFLPNMYTALKDFCSFSDLEKNKTYMIGDFFRHINQWGHIAIEDIKEDRNINLALSNALRLMHDKGEIELIRASDSKEIWHLYEDKSHSIEREVTHIKYKGGK